MTDAPTRSALWLEKLDLCERVNCGDGAKNFLETRIWFLQAYFAVALRWDDAFKFLQKYTFGYEPIGN